MTDPECDLYKKYFMLDIATTGFYVLRMVIDNIVLYEAKDKIGLPSREAPCIEWVSNRNIFGDIENILCISNHIVKMYLNTTR